MLHTTNPVIKHKAGLLNLAEELSNLSKACKIMGVSRDTFYRYRELADEGGVDALINRSRRAPNLKNRTDEATNRLLLITPLNRPGFPGEYFICELRLPDYYFRWKHNKLFLLLPEEYGPAFPAIVDCYTSPPTLVWPVPLLSGFSSSYGVLPPLCKDH